MSTIRPEEAKACIGPKGRNHRSASALPDRQHTCAVNFDIWIMMQGGVDGICVLFRYHLESGWHAKAQGIHRANDLNLSYAKAEILPYSPIKSY